MKHLKIAAACLSLLYGLSTAVADQAQPPRVIAGFGSSVCDGHGDHLGQGGYVGRLQNLLDDRGWQVVDVSRGGDNTRLIQERWDKSDTPTTKPVAPDRFLLPHRPGYVLIGLSLGNEGIKTDDPARREQVFNQFRDGMLGLIEKCRAHGMRPVVVNCYARSDFGPADYDATQRMNLLINTWDVPSVNVLGAVDDGQGRWVRGFLSDGWHPSGGGYEEMFYTIVPTLFDAMDAGKSIPQRADTPGYARVESARSPTISFAPKDTMHAFAQAFWFRNASDGTLAQILTHVAELQTSTEDFGESCRVVPTDRKLTCTLSIQDGALIYRGAGDPITVAEYADDNENWRQVVVSHGPARGVTTLFVDGRQVAQTQERLIPTLFALGGGAEADIRDWFVYRTSLNGVEVGALDSGAMVQSSLEVYAPLRDESFEMGRLVENRAQSLSEARVVTPSIQPVIPEPVQRSSDSY